MNLFDIGITKIIFDEKWERVSFAEVIIGDDRVVKHPATVSRDFLIQQIHAGLRVYLVREVTPSWYAPLTRVDILTIAGSEYLKATNNKDPFDDLG